MNISPDTMRSNANAWGVNLPITWYIDNLRQTVRSGPAPTTDECAENGAGVAELDSDAEENPRLIARGGHRCRACPAGRADLQAQAGRDLGQIDGHDSVDAADDWDDGDGDRRREAGHDDECHDRNALIRIDFAEAGRRP